MRLLLLGPLPPPVGGATVLFQQLNEYLKESNSVELITVDTTSRSKNPLMRIALSIKLIFLLLINIHKTDVVFFHTSLRGAYQFGVAVNIICKLFGKPWGFRGFGGNYYDWYQSSTFLKRLMLKYGILSADVVLFETKQLIKQFSEMHDLNYEWYPNSRYIKSDSSYGAECKKLVFIGHVKPEKGVNEILSIESSLPNDVTVDVYGPLQNGITENDFLSDSVFYKGVLSPDEVMSTLSKYDALVFPTFYDGEGYPGVILESFACGMPVISTKWKMIPEIVDDSSGILIEPKNKDELKKAILKMTTDSAYYASLHEGVIAKAKLYDMSYWNQYFLGLCLKLEQ